MSYHKRFNHAFYNDELICGKRVVHRKTKQFGTILSLGVGRISRAFVHWDVGGFGWATFILLREVGG
ncbi:MAG: hypothetical protein V3U75_12815 [Methylococcaceae bacterium]